MIPGQCWEQGDGCAKGRSNGATESEWGGSWGLKKELAGSAGYSCPGARVHTVVYMCVCARTHTGSCEAQHMFWSAFSMGALWEPQNSQAACQPSASPEVLRQVCCRQLMTSGEKRHGDDWSQCSLACGHLEGKLHCL